jgi:hypothetical protein
MERYLWYITIIIKEGKSLNTHSNFDLDGLTKNLKITNFD